MRPRARRFPFGPLAAATGTGTADEPDLTQMAWAAGMDRAQLRRDFVAGGLTHRQADRVACSLGCPPECVWDDYLQEAETA